MISGIVAYMSKNITGIMGATEEEIARLLEIIEAPMKHIVAKGVFVQGTIHERPVVVTISGIGKVNAAMCAQQLISTFHCTHILNIGSAGALDDSLAAGDVVLATDTLEHDFDATGFGYEPGHIPQMDTSVFKSDTNLLEQAQHITGFHPVLGRIVSGDVFVASRTNRATLVELYHAIATDMESAAVGHVCHSNSVPFLAIRAISDNASEDANVHFTKNIATIAVSPCDIAAELIKLL